MSEAAQGSTASEGHSSDAGASAAGSPSEGSDGTQTSADTFAQERATLQERARTEQSRADRLQAELDRAAAASQGGQEGRGEQAAPTADPAVTALTEQVRGLEQMLRSQALAPIVEGLKGEFAQADPSLFEKAVEFDSPEALRAAVEASHAERKAFGESYAESKLAELRAQYAAEYGVSLTPAPVDGGQAPSGDPTLDQLRNVSVEDLPDDETLDRLLRSVNT